MTASLPGPRKHESTKRNTTKSLKVFFVYLRVFVVSWLHFSESLRIHCTTTRSDGPQNAAPAATP
jgi:hypothetical protein